MIPWVYDFDWALFFSALISSTLFPGGSEALLLLKLNEAASHPIVLVLIATSGNVLGSSITYAMGFLGFEFAGKWLKIPEEKKARAEQYFDRFGKGALLFAWLPIIGDPLCLVAGMLRFNFLFFLALVTTGKLFRYALLAIPFY